MTFARPIAVDLFCGGGGTTTGLRAAGLHVLAAINHDASAIAMHAANHPDTLHLRNDVFAVDPLAVVGRHRLDVLSASPDCTHHSRAKGGKPRDAGIRDLAWVVPTWARAVRPRILFIENVAEFAEWGPLDDDGHPVRARRGETFRQWVASLELLGYRVEWRVLSACDYGAPTLRKRLYVVARCDGRPIRWPGPTHAKDGMGGLLPWRTAAECIDWDDLGTSIFERARPLAENTQRRIAAGLVRYVLTSARPFILCHTHGGRLEPIDEPMRTITTAHRGERALVAPYLVHIGNGERAGQAPRTYDAQRPLGTVVAGGGKHALISAWLAKHYTGVVGSDLERPLGAVTAVDHHSLVTAWLTKDYGSNRSGADLEQPLGTVTAGAGGGHHGLVAAFLTKYYGAATHGQALSEPLHTVVGKARFGLVTVNIDGETYAVADIRMRMLQPRELARANGLPDSYVLTGNKTQQIGRIGNMVVPQVAEAVVGANLEGA